MNRLLAMLLALALLLGLTPAALAEAEADAAPAEEAAAPVAAPLPEVGEVIHGFEVIELRDDPMDDATVVRFEHQKTGAELYYIANDDTNRAFDLTFFTDPIDNTGLPHVFEHATTAGSRKYPSSSLFFNLEFRSYHTFFNAMTGKRFTTYPVASLSEAQLLKYADYYTDSCFHPTLMENEQVYRTEAWRYRLDDAEDELTIEGTVYSEMLGAWTLSRVAMLNALRAMFPGSLVGNDAGGDPDFIPDMTYEMLTGYHDLYYHPSNCAAYLYGLFEDYGAFLELLDGYFSEYDRREFTRTDDGYTPIDAPVTLSLPFPVEQGSDTTHGATVFYGFVCPGLKAEGEQALLMNTLTDLLADGASALQQALQKAIPYGRFGAYIEISGPEYAIVFYADHVDEADAETFRGIVDSALEDVAAEGFPQEQVDGVMASLKIGAMLTRENSDPVEGIVVNMASYYASTGNPWELLDYREGLFEMDNWNRDGRYAEAVSRWLLGNPATALVTTWPQPGAKEEKDAALAERLAQVKAGMSEAEIADIVAASAAGAEKEDAAEYVAQLQGVTVASLPEEWTYYDVTDETDEKGVRHIDAVAGVTGIGNASVLLDAAGLPQEDLHWFSLYTDLMGKLDTAAHDKAALARLMSRYLYGGALSLSLPHMADGSYHPYLRLNWIALDEDLDEGYDLMRELLLDTKLDDPDRLLEQVQVVRTALKSSISSAPANTLLRRGLGRAEEIYAYSAYATGVEYYEFLGEVEQLLQDDPEAVVNRLRVVQTYFNNRAGAVTLFAGSPESIALNRGLADGLLASLDEREIVPAEYDFTPAGQSEALIIDSGAQHNLLLADYATLGLEGFEGGLDVLSNVVDDLFLFPLLRDQYGVYTPMTGAMSKGGMYLYAYRDPNISETFAVFDELGELVAGLDIDQETVDGYILSAYSNYAMPQGQLTGAISAATLALENRPQDEALAWMRQLKQVTPETLRGYADLFVRMSDDGVRLTGGGAAAINAVADLYDAVLNPFGAVDATQVELTDAPEGSDHYDAVRFAFEEGFMLPLTEDTFGVDEPATCGDLLAALYVLAGGEANPEAALEAFSQYGLVTADTDLSAPIAPEDIWGLLSALVGEEIPALVETASPDGVTRAELAEALMAFSASMEEDAA